MSKARGTFFDAMASMRSLSAEGLLTDGAPPDYERNRQAQILRNGLVIGAFALFESYIEDRLEEEIVQLALSKMGFAVFSERLRRFLVVDAVRGLSTRMDFLREASDRQIFAERHLPTLASFGSTPPVYTGLGFSPRGSNVNSDDVAVLLKAFGVSDIWQKLSAISSQLGATRISPKDDFDAFSRLRHQCAHDSTNNVPTATLQTILDVAVILAIGIDLLLSNAVKSYRTAKTHLIAESAADRLNLKFRLLDRDASGFVVERLELGGKGIKRYPDEAAATAVALSRRSGARIVVRDERSLPIRLIA